MDDPDSPVSKLAWSWVVDAIASSGDLVDWETLRGLVVLCENLGNEVSEVVALRILERLYDPAKVFKGSASLSSNQQDFQFDSCESLVQILEHVMDLSTLTKLKMYGSSTLAEAASDQLGRKFHAFIQRRKTSLPKCFLEQLCDRAQKGGVCPIDLESGKLPLRKKRGRDGDGSIASTEQYSAPPDGVELSEDASRRNAPCSEGEVHESAQEVQMAGIESRILSDANEQNWRPAQCTGPQTCQQPEAPSYCTQLHVCIKCNEGGEVLICGASSCPNVVHERCLGFKARFDSKGDFICPVCAYSRALSDLLSVKKELSLFRANLGHWQLDQSKVNGHPTIRGRDVDKSVKFTFAQTTSKDKPEGPAIPCEDVPSKQKDAYPIDRASEDQQQEGHLAPCNADSAPICSSKEGEEEYVAVKKCRHVKRKLKLPIEQDNDTGLHGSDSKQQLHGPSKNASCAASGDITGTTEAINLKTKPSRKCLRPQARQELAKDASGASHNNSDGTSAEESCRESRKYSLKDQDRGISFYDVNTPTPLEKRINQRTPWTEEEEEKLKEGYRRYGRSQWKAILEYGRSVFLRGRTTVDLKDKWRNLTKKHPELLQAYN